MDQYKWADPRSRTAFPVASPGLPFIYAAAFATLVFALLGYSVIAIAGIVITVAVCLFFRDPDRATPVVKNVLVAPADGRVVYAGKVETNPYVDGPCIKLGIFMSVFNVHVNRMPFAGVVTDITHHPGKFRNVSKEEASLQNERNALILRTGDNRTIGVVQIAGLIARRIVTWANEGDTVRAGQRFGMICFGSRVDLYLPPETLVTVKVGERVSAGSSIVGRLPEIAAADISGAWSAGNVDPDLVVGPEAGTTPPCNDHSPMTS